MKRFLTFTLILSACGQEPTYKVYGIDVYADVPHSPTKDQLTLFMTTFFTHMSREVGRSQKEIKDTVKHLESITFSTGLIPITSNSDGDTIKVVGVYYPWEPSIELTLYHTCLGRISLVHELLHHTDWYWDKWVDYDHVSATWQEGGLEERLENSISDAICVPTDGWIRITERTES